MELLPARLRQDDIPEVAVIIRAPDPHALSKRGSSTQLAGTSASLISSHSSPRHRPKLHDDSTRPSRSLPASAPPVVAAAPEQEEQYNDDEEGFHGGVAPFPIGCRARAVPVEKPHRQAETTAESSPIVVAIVNTVRIAAGFEPGAFRSRCFDPVTEAAEPWSLLNPRR
jgi:hypothetical protein